MPGGYVTTHVLDTTRGQPAAGLEIDVYRLNGMERRKLLRVTTNGQGRTEAPVISGPEMVEAEYELLFHAGDYLARVHGPVDGVRFLNVVPVRFGVSDRGQHYHVPLLLSPFGYSTYRGS